jgi:uncharacterized membrane protein YagU involved in acid resistance
MGPWLTRQFVGKGIATGMIAGIVMGMYAMLASATFLGQGFFTPLYGIASPLIGPQPMTTSMQQGTYFTPGPALLGLVVHMLWAALYGVIFGLLARAAHLTGAPAIVAGLVYGIAVMLAMSLVVLPLVGAGAMPGMVGWPSFTIEPVARPAPRRLLGGDGRGAPSTSHLGPTTPGEL